MSTTDTPDYSAPDDPRYDEEAYHPDGEVFQFLVPRRRTEIDRMGITIDLAHGLSDLPETSQTFIMKRVFDGPTRLINPAMLSLLGAWPVPDRFTGSSSNSIGTNYVNPAHPEKWMYSPAFSTCECGALVASSCGDDLQRIPGAITDHADDCCPIWRWRARHTLWERRREMMVKLLEHGHRTTEIGHRLGYTVGGLHSKVRDHDVDSESCREVARERIANTAAANLHLYTPGEMAPVFGYSPAGLRRLVRQYTDVDAFQMRGVRARLSD